MSGDIRDLFQEVFETNEGWKADCPSCGKEKRLWWSEEKSVGCCFTEDCKFHYSRGGVTEYRLRAYMEREGIEFSSPTRIVEKPKDRDSKLPEEFKVLDALDKPLRESLYAYLLSRGLLKKTLQAQKVGYCSEGKYWGYIVFPVFDSEGKVIYWQGRRFKNRDKKFYNPPATNKKEIFYQIGGNHATHRIVIVESIINALTLDTGKTISRTAIIALLGKTLSEHHLDHIRAYDKNLREIILALDPDAANEAVNMAKKLSSHGLVVKIARVPEGQDINTLGRGKAWELIFHAQLYNPLREQETRAQIDSTPNFSGLGKK